MAYTLFSGEEMFLKAALGKQPSPFSVFRDTACPEWLFAFTCI